MWVKLITTMAVLLVLDFVWLTVNKSGYASLITKVQHTPLQLNYVGAVFSYVCIFLAITFYVLPAVENDTGSKLWLSLKYGGFLGLLIYGVFNFTNIAIFSNYDIKMAVKDTIWGITLFTITTWIVSIAFAQKPKLIIEFTPKA